MIAGLRNKKQGAVDHQGTGMEYAYLEAREEDSEDIVERVGIYTLDGDQDHAVLLQSVISKETLADAVVLVVVDLSRPWLIMDSLKKCASIPPAPYSPVPLSLNCQPQSPRKSCAAGLCWFVNKLGKLASSDCSS